MKNNRCWHQTMPPILEKHCPLNIDVLVNGISFERAIMATSYSQWNTQTNLGYMNLNQFPGIVVPRSRDGRIEGSPGRLIRIFYDFRFFHISRWAGLIFSVVSLLKCDLLNFRQWQWHFRPSYIQNTSCEFSSQNEFFAGHPVFALQLHIWVYSTVVEKVSCWDMLASYQIGRTPNRCVYVRVKNVVDRWLINARAT